MPERYFVKELNPIGKWEELGRYAYVWDGNDRETAHRRARELDEGHIFVYEWNSITNGATITEVVYKNGVNQTPKIRMMSMDNLLNPSINPEFLEEFTPKERAFLEDIARDTLVA